MTNKRTFLFKSLLVLVAILLVLAGCSNSGNDGSQPTNTVSPEPTVSATPEAEGADNEASSPEGDTVAYPIEIEHALGKTVITSKPERVVTVQWANHDVVLALGVVPVGFSAANFGVQDGSGLLPWTAQKLQELGASNPNVFHDTDGLDFEAISDANPDVILASYSGLTQEDYDLLSEIAPVVAYPVAPWATTWREQVVLNSTGMGMAAEGDKLIESTEALLQEKLTQYPQLKDKKIVWVNFRADDLSRLHIYTPVDSRVAFLHELGLVYPDAVMDQITDPKSYSLQLSAENAELLSEADILVGYGNEELYQAVKADSLLGKIPAIEKGAVAFITSDTPLVAAGTPNPLSIAFTIDEYLALLGAAADKSNE